MAPSAEYLQGEDLACFPHRPGSHLAGLDLGVVGKSVVRKQVSSQAPKLRGCAPF